VDQLTLADAMDVDVRPAEPGDEDAICAVCAAGFSASAEGLLSPHRIRTQIARYYDPECVRGELAAAPPGWLGYVVAETTVRVVGACGGGLSSEAVGQVLVLYLDLTMRGRGIGSALLQEVTEQQIALGATRQRVSVIEGNEMGLPFYRARGFVQVDRVPFVRGDSGQFEAYSLVLERTIA
jgi:GNAT superfamily N-acetyltransferase